MQHCHPHCLCLSGVPTETVGDSRLQSCAAMSNNSCVECGHSYNMHMHRTYDLVTVKRSFISPEVQRKINEKKGAESKMEATVSELKNLVKEFEDEQKEVHSISATYGAFLKDVAIIAYNDALGDYLEMCIHQENEKDPRIRDKDLVDRLQKSKQDYEEEKALIVNAMKRSGAASGSGFTPDQIARLQKDLFKMKHFGASLKRIFDNIEGGNMRNSQQRKVVTTVPRGWGGKAYDGGRNLVSRAYDAARTLVRGNDSY